MKERIDKVLTDRGLVSSRSQAKSLIEKGDVTSNGRVMRKSGELIEPDAELSVASSFVGRGAFKLQKALEIFRPEIKDRVFLDVGASTGGFTEILLLEGAQKVYAIDVGHDQLAAKLRSDPRVINMEGTNIREILELPELASGAVMDLSFISITKVLEIVSTLLVPRGFLIALVKPQFEAGLERLPKDGVIKSEMLRNEILKEVTDFATTHGWTHHQTIPSPIEGKNGNVEFLSYYTKN
jgi:23S rRNA (cytidine1920-2'-O)/16S rRNA (cytidine1409-2'-O)-methyltransferase